MRKLVLCTLVAVLGVLLILPATASADTTAQQIAALQAAVKTLQGQVSTLQTQVATLQTQTATKRNILVGTVAPTSATGCVGDIYINTMAWVVYGPKTCSGWGSGTSLIGPKGATGATGATGAPGSVGATGPVGPAGPIGPAGSQGPKGDTGAQGPAGKDGALGSQGPKGDTGAPGPAGAQGPKGDTGTTGATGPVGPQGDTGATGPAGPAGLKGDAGDPGVNGQDGKDGAAWYTGDGVSGRPFTASPGDLYLDAGTDEVWQYNGVGWTYTSANLKGKDGADGQQGPQGQQGSKGDTGAVGPQGPQGQPGPAGADGAMGATGARGADGATWLAGDSSPIPGLGRNGDFYLDKAAMEVYQKADDSWADLAGLVGPQGLPGPKGETGAAGPQGPQGLNGDTGATGATGPAGPQGPKGDSGQGSGFYTTRGRPSDSMGTEGDYCLSYVVSQSYPYTRSLVLYSRQAGHWMQVDQVVLGADMQRWVSNASSDLQEDEYSLHIQAVAVANWIKTNITAWANGSTTPDQMAANAATMWSQVNMPSGFSGLYAFAFAQ